MKESYMADEAAELLGITKNNFLFRCRSLGITSIGRGKGYAASDVMLVGRYKELPQSEKGVKRIDYRPHYQRRNPISNAKYHVYRSFIKQYMKENNIEGPLSYWKGYSNLIYKCKEKDVQSYEQFLKEVIDGEWKRGREKGVIVATDPLARKIKVYGNVYDYMKFDPTGTFDEELIDKFNELKEERPEYDDRPIREIYKEAMLSLMYKYHYINNDQYFDYKIAIDGEYVEYLEQLDRDILAYKVSI